MNKKLTFVLGFKFDMIFTDPLTFHPMVKYPDIAANLLGRRYLGLEKEDKFLSMSKARREEIENSAVRSDYLERLAKAKIILPPDNFFLADDSEISYGAPWL